MNQTFYIYTKYLKMNTGYPYVRFYSGLRKMILLLSIVASLSSAAQTGPRTRISFHEGWKFFLGDVPNASSAHFQDAGWRSLQLPHDWSIEGSFSEKNPATVGGGGLPGGIGWYRKSIQVPVFSGMCGW